MDSNRGQDQEAGLYLVEVGGSVPESWKDRFGAEGMHEEGGNTVLEIRVRDQSELFGRLRRVHDLNLRLISLTRTVSGQEKTGTDEGTSGVARKR